MRKVDLFNSANGCPLSDISKFTTLEIINRLLRQVDPFIVESGFSDSHEEDNIQKHPQKWPGLLTDVNCVITMVSKCIFDMYIALVLCVWGSWNNHRHITGRSGEKEKQRDSKKETDTESEVEGEREGDVNKKMSKERKEGRN